MDKSTSISEVIKDEPALVKSVSDNLDLLRPSSGYFSIFKGRGKDAAEYGKTKYTLIKDVEEYQPGIYDKPLPCFGCGVGWFSVSAPLYVVLCNIPIFWELLPQRSKRTSWPCSVCDSCFGLLSFVVHHTAH